MKKISVLTPCYNEIGNVELVYQRVKAVFANLPQYRYEHIFVDNASVDGTQEKLREMAAEDNNVKVLFNTRNFGIERSCVNAFLQCRGDAVINLACDLQDPPELIPVFLEGWETGYKLVMGQKRSTKDHFLVGLCRKAYYAIMGRFSENGHLKNVTGYGLYDKKIVDMIRWMEDPLPYTRGIICDLGYDIKLIPYDKQERKRGKSSYNFLSYLDTAIWGVTSTSKKPLRYATLAGCFFSVFFFFVACVYFILKLIYWDSFDMGIAPLMIGLFFIGSVQLAYIGILGEYVGAILTRVTKRPIAVVKERLNFEEYEADEKK